MPPRLPSAGSQLVRPWPFLRQGLRTPPRTRIRTTAARRPFATQQPPRTVAEFLRTEPDCTLDDAVVHGYIRSARKLKSDQFLNIGDGSCVKHLQAIVPRSLSNEPPLSSLRVGTAVRLRGSWIPSKKREQFQSHELKVNEVEILGPSDPGNYPIQNKYQTLEFLRTLPHLRSRLPLNSALLRLRSDAITILNNFFSTRGFTQAHPPLITSSDCEGAGEVFTLTAGKPKPAVDEKPKERPDPFFRSSKYLTVSGQLHLEALSQSLGDVWTLSPTFRAEKSDTSRHMAEFYMLEAEMTFVEDMNAVMDLAEDMIRYLVSSLLQTSYAAQDILAASKRVTGDSESLIGPDEQLQARWDGLGPSSPRWPRISYTEAISLLQAAPVQFERKPIWGAGLQAEHERWLAAAVSEAANPGFRTPVFITHYPRDIKAFYMLESDGRSGEASAEQTCPTVDCFDLLVPDVCEIAGGSMREHRLQHLLAAMNRNGLPAPSAKPGRSTSNLDWYVDLRRWGSPPHGGFGIGFDRLLVYLVGAQSVKDVVAFPRWWGRCDC